MISNILRNIMVISSVCGAVSLLLLLSRKLFLPKGGAWMRSIIWVVLLIRLCIPFMPSLPVGLVEIHILQPAESVYDSPGISDKSAEAPVQNQADILPVSKTEMPDNNIIPAGKTFCRLPLLATVYFAGLTIFAFIAALRKTMLNKSLSILKACENVTVLQIFEKVKRQLKIRSDIALLIDEKNMPPAISGILRPRVLIPKSLTDNTNTQELEYVFIHELTHYKNFDTAKLLLLEAAACLHWFNPVLHMMKNTVIQDIELACDEKVLSIISKQNHADYGKMLVEFLHGKPRSYPLVLTSNFVVKRSKSLKERIIMIKKFKKKRYGVMSFAAVVLISLLLVALPSCKSAEKAAFPSYKSTEEAALEEPPEENGMLYGEKTVIFYNNSRINETDFKDMVKLIKNWCDDQDLSYNVKAYINASGLLLSLPYDTSELGAEIRGILSDDLGLSPQQIMSDDGSRLDTSIAELILKYN